MDALRVGLIGLGTVGGGVAQILTHQAARMAHRSGRPIQLTRVAVRDLTRSRSIELPGTQLTTEALAVATAPDVDLVVELIGGLKPARELVLAALNAGKDVVTANKALLCEHGPELFRAARERGRCIAFEAAVAGGVPIIHTLGQAMTANQITSIEAILNGTSNFILTQMFQKGAAYADAVAEAQALGFAEADPSMDVQGTDAAQKLGLLTLLAFGTRVTPDQFLVQGIDTIDLDDLRNADELGYAVKLLATARLVEGQLEMHTQPTLIRKDRPIARTDGPFNIIGLTGDVVGTTWYSGQGAGGLPTASAVVSDIVDVAAGRAKTNFDLLDLWGNHPPFSLQPVHEINRRYYMRFLVEDRAHVMAEITDVLGRNDISLASVMQRETAEPEDDTIPRQKYVPLVIMTHRTTEGRLRAAAIQLEKLGCIRTPWVCMPMEGIPL
ncbi:MAG: homoserine dehydrogenase [Planctomycetota bacterium]|nr:MAG: homoserine dehydrogenase [Planctomycetota bacterium]